MANHITVNGQTYTSVEAMPSEVRRQYEAAMQLLSKNAGAPADGAATNINISTGGSDPGHRVFRVVTQVSATRIVVNGKEYARWENVPPEARAALQSAGVNPIMPLAGGLASDQKQPLSIGCQATALAAFCTFLTVVGLTVFLIFCLPPIVQVLEARSWVPVPCRIVSSGMSTSRHGIHINVVYTYSYNGQSYQSNRYQFRQLHSGGGRAEKEQVVQRLSPGSSANCFVNPADPSQAVIARDFNWDMFAELVPLAFACVGIAGILWSVHMRRRLRAM